MANYDESDDIDALLRSSLRGDETNPPVVDGGAPESAETAARRRRIRFDDSLDEGTELSDELRAELERAAMARATIPDSSKKAIPSKESARVNTDLWKDCDRGIAAQKRLTGTHVAWSSAQRVIFLIMQLIPITEFAPELYEWGPNKTKNTTMVKMATTYAFMRPSAIKMLTDATRSTGAEARALIDDAKQAIFAGDTCHDICVYALMIYHWSTHADSEKRDLVDTVIDDYLKTQDEDIEKLLAITKKGKFLNIDDDVEIALQGAWELPGMARLNYQENDNFTFAWLDLWTAVMHMLCFKEKERADIGEINRALSEFIIDSPDHADCRQKRAVHEVHTSQKMKYMKVAEICKRMGMTERIPDKYSRANNFLAAVDDETFRKLERILEDADSITDVDMTYEKTVNLCLLAESRLKKRISAISMARQLRVQPSTQKKKKEEAPATPGATEKKKGSDARKQKPKKDDTTEYLPLPDKLKSMSKEQGDAFSKE